MMSISLQKQSFLREITSTINVVNIKSGGDGEKEEPSSYSRAAVDIFFKVLSLQDYFTVTIDSIKLFYFIF